MVEQACGRGSLAHHGGGLMAPQSSRLYCVRILGYFFWAAVAGAAGIGLGIIALHRGEHINSLWLGGAGGGRYATAFRFFCKVIAARGVGFDNEGGSAAPRPRH